MSARILKLALVVAALGALAVTGLAGAEVIQKGDLRLTSTGDLSPTRLPRHGSAPIKVSVGGKITTSGKAKDEPPKLTKMSIDLNRNGTIDSTGLPICPYSSIQPGSSSRALSACKASLVGKGTFDAEISLAGQDPYPSGGKMLLFNSVEKGKPVLFGHLYAPRPFATSFVIVFKISKLGKGDFGTSMSTKFPATLLNWGNITGIDLTISRTFSSHGSKHSYLSAGCPTPKGVPKATFPLTRTSFGFDDGRTLTSTLVRTCQASGT